MGKIDNVLQFRKDNVSTKPIEDTATDLLVSMASQLSRIEMKHDDLIEQNNYVLELLSKKYPMNVTESNYLPESLLRRLFPVVKTKEHNQAQVPLYIILKVGAALVGFLCIASLATWLLSNVSLVNPFVALLGLIATPFFYWMGYIEKNKGD